MSVKTRVPKIKPDSPTESAPSPPSPKTTIVWTFDDGGESIIAGPRSPDWAHLETHNAATLIKSDPHRRVWRLVIDRQELYIKEFIHTSLRDRLRRLIRGPQAKLEWNTARIAADLGVRTVRFVAYGVAGNRSFLVSDALVGAIPLAEAWIDTGNRRDTLTRATALLMADAHNRGFIHADAHPRNILVVPGQEGQFTAYFADVYAARCPTRVTDADAAQNIAQLRQWFRTRATRSQRLRFLKTYCLRRSEDQSESARALTRRLAPQIVANTNEQAEKLWARRDRRILADNKYFTRILAGHQAIAHVTLRPSRPDIFPTPSTPTRTACQWRELLNQDETPEDVTILATTLQAAPRSRRLPMRLAFEMGHRLRNRDLPCRRPIAVVERRVPPAQTRSELWCDALPHTQGLFALARDSQTTLALRRTLCRALANLIALMADRGAAVETASSKTFGFDATTGILLIENPTDVLLRPRDVQRDRVTTLRALGKLFTQPGQLHRTDAVRLLKHLAPANWKQLWRLTEEGNRQ